MYVTFLSSSLDRDDDRLKIEGYDLRRSDDPSGLKKAVACIYYKEHIPIIRRDDLCSPSNGLVTEIRLENEKCFPIVATDHLVKTNTSLKIFLQTYILLWII